VFKSSKAHIQMFKMCLRRSGFRFAMSLDTDRHQKGGALLLPQGANRHFEMKEAAN
jgi:hypothetical protein